MHYNVENTKTLNIVFQLFVQFLSVQKAVIYIYTKIK